MPSICSPHLSLLFALPLVLLALLMASPSAQGAQDNQSSTLIDAAVPNQTRQAVVLSAVSSAPSVSIAPVVNPAEPSGIGSFVVSLSAMSATDTVVSLGIAGTAQNGVDYNGVDGQPLPATVTIPALTLERSVAIVPVADTLVEGDETIVINIQLNSGYQLGAHYQAQMLLLDVVLPSVSIAAVLNPAEPNRIGSFMVTMSATSTTDTVVALGIAGTAQNGFDYTGVDGQPLPATVTIPALTLQRSVAIVPIADTLTETDETINVSILLNSGYQLGATYQAQLLLFDVDRVSPGSTTSGTSGTAAVQTESKGGCGLSSGIGSLLLLSVLLVLRVRFAKP